MMQYTLKYCSSRADVWHWYWKAWRAGAWAIHLTLGVAAAFFLSGSGFARVNFVSWGLWFLAAQPTITALFAAVPQVMFKPAERTLEVDSRGWSTRIGNTAGSRTWNEVASIGEDRGNVILAGTNGNALIIPPGAFASPALRAQFLQDVRRWQRSVST